MNRYWTRPQKMRETDAAEVDPNGGAPLAGGTMTRVDANLVNGYPREAEIPEIRVSSRSPGIDVFEASAASTI